MSLPRLVDIDWRVDVKQASNAVARMSAPTTLVSLVVQENATKEGVVPPTRNVDFEFDPASLAVMLEGLAKIRDQLAGI